MVKHDYEIGETFYIDGVEYKVFETEYGDCEYCDLIDSTILCESLACRKYERHDKRNVIFRNTDYI
jgi:hypothetical protein